MLQKNNQPSLTSVLYSNLGREEFTLRKCTDLAPAGTGLSVCLFLHLITALVGSSIFFLPLFISKSDAEK